MLEEMLQHLQYLLQRDEQHKLAVNEVKQCACVCVSMAYKNHRIKDVVDDAAELDVATKIVVGLGGFGGDQTARHWGSQI